MKELSEYQLVDVGWVGTKWKPTIFQQWYGAVSLLLSRSDYHFKFQNF